ncbi:sensor histidine kinase [Fulvivirga ligni]|uniref:sensor histidine kinase n=1 Tax=Fulvivirga ligni TaxID=2904246 RepID=UPI001F3D4882|nr:HAMP domain-containing sensor histidine kinase [Fulvivirga ligni]UII20162.1 HAMP domain-containing histidine kinase [Fulvivirga ligni]
MPYVDNAILNPIDDININPLFNSSSYGLKVNRAESAEEKAEKNKLEFNQLVHDLKSPVNSLKGIVELAQLRLQGGEIKEYLEMMDSCLAKLESKITNTLDMCQKGLLGNEAEEISFEDQIQDILMTMRHVKGFEEVSFDIQVAHSAPFYAPKPVIESILQNLFENAVKYRCPEKERCEVSVMITDHEDGIRIKFSDNGLGIPDDKLPHIFEAHFKSEQHKSSNGLGLFIVQKAIEKLHGDLKVYSKEGEGTTFVINIPNQR